MSDDLAIGALLCSRICHDLISPVGAIGNGMELMAHGGGEAELELIGDSAKSAAAALRFLRIAFGAGGALTETSSVDRLGPDAAGFLAGERIELRWSLPGAEISRDGARLLYLLALAAKGALPLGGTLTLAAAQEAPLRLAIHAEGRRAGLTPAAAAILAGDFAADELSPREAHLAFLSRLAAAAEGRIAPRQAEGRLALELFSA